MNSKLYLGQLQHRRFLPRAHQFQYPLFMMYLDLDELPSLFQRFWLWSVNRGNIASFDRSYYLGDKERDLSDCVRELVQQQTGLRPPGPIRLLTHLRYYGYIFNPVSFYYCFEDDGETLHSIVAEINNTPWNETHCYVLPAREMANDFFHFDFDKEFHVSPFNSMDQRYCWRFSMPTEKLSVHMKVLEDGKRHFDARLHMKAKEINSPNLAVALMRFPLMTLRVVTAIYFQALRLWLKKVPLHDHPANKQTSETGRQL